MSIIRCTLSAWKSLSRNSLSFLTGKGSPNLLHIARTKDDSLPSQVKDGYVPKSKDQISQWLRVVSTASPERDVMNYPYDVVYACPLDSSSSNRLEIRIQGVFEDGSLRQGVLVQYVTLPSRSILVH